MKQPTAAPSLLGVFAHPDDESLLAGGVLAQHAASGARTAVVTATGTADSHRATELAEALSVLGAGAPRLLGYADARKPASAPDGAVRLIDAPLDEAVGRLVAHIREVRPDIVVGHDALGQLTGHSDHRRAHQITLLAVEAAGLPRLFPDAGEPWQPAVLYAATHSESGVGRLGPLLQSVGKTLLAVPDAYVTATVDVSPWAAVKMEAILAHRSEAARERSLPGLIARLPEPDRNEIISTEQFTRLFPGPTPGDTHQLSPAP
ncbi:PIG-L deacetylase family protein [[Kitasatospora] papulosa]|uniref:PIG-L deacetylase family protein n=1 Tax=[Kitasatospora] papulosa TaxID=1464011 RepID=UPI0037F9C706